MLSENKIFFYVFTGNRNSELETCFLRFLQLIEKYFIDIFLVAFINTEKKIESSLYGSGK